MSDSDELASLRTELERNDLYAAHMIERLSERWKAVREAMEAELLTLRATCHRLQAEQEQLRQQTQPPRMFPVQDGPAIPWDIIAPFDKQCQENHGGQTLEDLARRGGLGTTEAIAVLLGVDYSDYWDNGRYRKADHAKYVVQLVEIVESRSGWKQRAEKAEADLSTLRQQQAETQQERDELPLLYDGRTLEAVLDDWVERLHLASKEDDYKAIADEIDTVTGRLWLYTELRKPAELTIKLRQAEAAMSALQASLRSLVKKWRATADDHGQNAERQTMLGLFQAASDSSLTQVIMERHSEQLEALVPPQPREDDK